MVIRSTQSPGPQIHLVNWISQDIVEKPNHTCALQHSSCNQHSHHMLDPQSDRRQSNNYRSISILNCIHNSHNWPILMWFYVQTLYYRTNVHTSWDTRKDSRIARDTHHLHWFQVKVRTTSLRDELYKGILLKLIKWCRMTLVSQAVVRVRETVSNSFPTIVLQK